VNPTLAFQLQGFYISIGAGVVLGIIYDLFRIFRTVFHSEKRAVFFQDLFYMLCAALVTFLVALGVNYGEVRFYILAGEAIGWCLYFFTVGNVTIRIFCFISRVLHRFLIDPVKRILQGIFCWIAGKLKIIGKKVRSAAINQKKRLKRHRDIVYNHSIKRRSDRLRKKQAGNRRKQKGRKVGRGGGAGYAGHKKRKAKG
jgi:spore cortex biosynthesis protein YabQ